MESYVFKTSSFSVKTTYGYQKGNVYNTVIETLCYDIVCHTITYLTCLLWLDNETVSNFQI